MVLKYPYPYKSWITLANDPDNTLIKDWNELNDFIWKELNLPFSNSIFLDSLNVNLPEQVNFKDNPEIISQNHDTIHTWGDYMHSRKTGFDREDAEEASNVIKNNNINARIWIDHAQFIGNLLHASKAGGVPFIEDASGHSYKNHVYTLDIIKKVGIKFIWNGKITDTIGQDRKIKPLEYFKAHSSNKLKAYFKYAVYKILTVKRLKKKFNLNVKDNAQYLTHRFKDGNIFYTFIRYGTWKDADIYGLGKIINPKKIDKLIYNEGTLVIYTHLGKRPADKMNEAFHIPQETKKALKYIQSKFLDKELMVSSTSELLKYLIIRDHISTYPSDNLINFKPDGILFKKITQKDLSGMKFSFKKTKKTDLSFLKITSENQTLKFKINTEEDQNVFTITFE